jgi:hypothetical protein
VIICVEISPDGLRLINRICTFIVVYRHATRADIRTVRYRSTVAECEALRRYDL